MFKLFEKQKILSEKWLKRYLNFIQKFNYDYGHKHHILPQSLYPEYKDLRVHTFNCKVLSFRAHYIAHYMLARALGGNMLYAFNRMNNSKEKIKFNSKLYSKFKEEHRLLLSEKMKINNPMFNEESRKKTAKSNTGKKASDITKAKMSASSYMKTEEARKLKSEQMKINNPMFKEEHRLAVSKAKIGFKHSEESKKKMSISKKGINVGKKHFQTKTVLIYDNFDRLIYFCEDGFANFCKYNKLPLRGFNESYKNNKVYDTRIIKYKEFIGWKIKKLNTEKGWFVFPQ